MIIKPFTDSDSDVQRLLALKAHTRATPKHHTAIDRQIKAIRSGKKGEREAAYHIDFHYGQSKNWVVAHDLRLEINGRVAQIDHLILGRKMDLFLCETKYWSQGIAINENKEFTAFYGNKAIGIPSPVEQSERHVSVVADALKSENTWRPKRLGMQIPIDIRSVIIVSTQSRITRPEGLIKKEFDNIIKADQFSTHTQDIMESSTRAISICKIVSLDTVQRLMESLVAQHKPIAIDYAAKFGLDKLPVTPSISPALDAAVKKPEAKKAKTYSCAACHQKVELKVARFCWFNKDKTGGLILCRTHQNKAGVETANRLAKT